MTPTVKKGTIFIQLVTESQFIIVNPTRPYALQFLYTDVASIYPILYAYTDNHQDNSLLMPWILPAI